MLLNPFCPLTTAKVLALKATILVLLTLLIKARVQIVARRPGAGGRWSSACRHAAAQNSHGLRAIHGG
ncbi:MAG: hypothetical protein NTV57_07690 [Cyanobacteria bacterium]|nr:hypothetical protein [Cyanobacteriota bacterium]